MKSLTHTLCGVWHRIGGIFNDEIYIRVEYFLIFKKFINLKRPKSYSEKLQWLKLYYRKPKFTQMVDKYEAKKYVEKIIGKEHIIETLGVWDSFEDIDFDNLPQRFVLKTTHDSGGIYIVKDKTSLDKQEAKRVLENSLKHDYYKATKEWPYKNVPRKIIAEKYMEDSSGELRDYKFFCFEGKMKAMFIATDRFAKNEETKFDFFDENFNHLPFTNGHPNSPQNIEKPQSFEAMKQIAEKLSEGFPHLRVDLYEINGAIYFGELTFYHWNGLVPFHPGEWDYKFGDWLTLPQEKILSE